MAEIRVEPKCITEALSNKHGVCEGHLHLPLSLLLPTFTHRPCQLLAAALGARLDRAGQIVFLPLFR